MPSKVTFAFVSVLILTGCHKGPPLTIAQVVNRNPDVIWLEESKQLPDRCENEVLQIESAWEDVHCVKAQCPNALDAEHFRWQNPHCLDPLEKWAKSAKIPQAFAFSYLRWITASHRNWDTCRRSEEQQKLPKCDEKIPAPSF